MANNNNNGGGGIFDENVRRAMTITRVQSSDGTVEFRIGPDIAGNEEPRQARRESSVSSERTIPDDLRNVLRRRATLVNVSLVQAFLNAPFREAVGMLPGLGMSFLVETEATHMKKQEFLDVVSFIKKMIIWNSWLEQHLDGRQFLVYANSLHIVTERSVRQMLDLITYKDDDAIFYKIKRDMEDSLKRYCNCFDFWFHTQLTDIDIGIDPSTFLRITIQESVGEVQTECIVFVVLEDTSHRDVYYIELRRANNQIQHIVARGVGAVMIAFPAVYETLFLSAVDNLRRLEGRVDLRSVSIDDSMWMINLDEATIRAAISNVSWIDCCKHMLIDCHDNLRKITLLFCKQRLSSFLMSSRIRRHMIQYQRVWIYHNVVYISQLLIRDLYYSLRITLSLINLPSFQRIKMVGENVGFLLEKA